MILVTGATGAFGNAVIDFLLQAGIEASQIAGLTRNAEKARNLKLKGIQITVGDYDDYPSLVTAFRDVDELLFISGSDTDNRLLQHEHIVKAAKEAHVKHIVYTSFEGKNETITSPLWFIIKSHLQTEKWIKESGIPYTILKNNLYMDFIPLFIGEKVLETETIYLPAGNGKVSAALGSEFAEATPIILASQNRESRTYRLTNTEAYSYGDVAKTISEITGKEIKYISPAMPDFLGWLRNTGATAEHINIYTGFTAAQAKGELDFITGDLENLLSRKPTSLKDYLKGIYRL